jgi:hypothetical protein
MQNPAKDANFRSDVPTHSCAERKFVTEKKFSYEPCEISGSHGGEDVGCFSSGL